MYHAFLLLIVELSILLLSVAEYKYSIFPLNQYLTIFNESILETVQVRPALKARVTYDLASTILYRLFGPLIHSDSDPTGFVFANKREENYNKEITIIRDCKT